MHIFLTRKEKIFFFSFVIAIVISFLGLGACYMLENFDYVENGFFTNNPFKTMSLLVFVGILFYGRSFKEKFFNICTSAIISLSVLIISYFRNYAFEHFEIVEVGHITDYTVIYIWFALIATFSIISSEKW